MLMAYDEAGSGAAVVLLHSSIADRRMWEPQWQPLAARYRVVRPDLRGFGGTPLPPERFSFGSDVVALLDEVGLQRAVLLDDSCGIYECCGVMASITVGPDHVVWSDLFRPRPTLATR